MRSLFLKGMKDGIPIMLGYLSVSFGFGILAVRAGLTVLQAVGISLTNVTSAGQAAGVGIIAAAGTIIEMILTQFVINVRYALMGLALSQKLDTKAFTLPHRLLVSFGITDEIFAVAISQEGRIKPKYMYGVIIVSVLGWVAGTYLGAAAGQILPESIVNAMGLVLYGMFIAIIIPPAKKSWGVLVVILLAAGLSMLFYYVFTGISSGFAIIISAILAAAIGALIFPVKDEEESE